MEKYKILEKLGEGAFGKVYKAVNKKSNEIVAIKKLNEKYKSKDDCLELREVKSLQKLKHHNITKLIEVILEGEELYLVF
jgi:serine/threonine protein kinase